MARPPQSGVKGTRENRIGERHPIKVAIEWAPIYVGRLHRRAKPIAATLDNLSVSGAGFESVTDPKVLVSSVLNVTIGGVTGHAFVRVVREEAAKGRTYYGIEFRDARLLDVARQLVTADVASSGHERPSTQPTARWSAQHRTDLDNWP